MEADGGVDTQRFSSETSQSSEPWHKSGRSVPSTVIQSLPTRWGTADTYLSCSLSQGSTFHLPRLWEAVWSLNHSREGPSKLHVMLGEPCPVLTCATPQPALPLYLTPTGDSATATPHPSHCLPPPPCCPQRGQEGPRLPMPRGAPLSLLGAPTQAHLPLFPSWPSPLVAQRARLTSICLLGLESRAVPLC